LRRRCAPAWLALLFTANLCGCVHWDPSKLVRPTLDIMPAELHERVLPPGELPVELPDPVRQTGEDKQAGPALPDWPATVETPVFTLPAAIAHALSHNPRLLSARADVERAQGQETVAFAPFLPQVEFLARYSATSPTLGAGAPGVTGVVETAGEGTHSFVQGELQMQWTLFDFGRRTGRYGQALSREHLARLQLERAKQTVAYDVTTAYLNVLLTAALRVVREEAIRSAEATLKDTRARNAGGVADRDDVLRAEVQLSETRDALVGVRQEEFAALARLNHVMGRNPALPLRVVDCSNETGGRRFDLTLGQSLELAAARRLEVGMARDLVAGSRYGRQATAAEFCPRIYSLASLGYVEGEHVQNGWQEGAGLRFEQNLFAGGRRLGELRAAEADVEAAVAGAQGILDSISLEVNLAWHAVKAAGERIDLSRPAIAQAQENLRLLRVKYRNGNSTPTDLVDAETTLTRTQQRLAAAIFQYLDALARMEYALGAAPGTCLPAARETPASGDHHS
jgi:outer membrane protein TolC